MTIALIATGGTISCTKDEHGALVPTATAAQLAACLDEPVRAIDFRRLDSSAITLEDLDELIDAVDAACADPEIDRVIVTHGTDTLEETAVVLALFHRHPTPVVLTGAMLPFDAVDADGPANLRGAARAEVAEGTGVAVHFGGMTSPAWGLRKHHTTHPDAFAPGRTLPDNTPLPPARLAGHDVAVIAAFPGAPRTLIDAAVSAGYRGIVVEALGAGNVNPQLGAGLADALEAGVQLVISTRVAHGPVSLVYGGPGGGATLGQLGAVGSGHLRAGQARIVLAAALATGTDVRDLFTGP